MAEKFVCLSVPTQVPKISSHLDQYKPCMLLKNSFSHNKYSPLQISSRKGFSLAVRALGSHIPNAKIMHGPEKEYGCRKGLGIRDFLKDKNILVTGATGFLAKVVIEKILRAQPQVGKLFLIIKAKDPESAIKRLKKEIIDCELFRCLRDVHGSKYEAFMLEKLVPIVGDVSLNKLGMHEDVGHKLAQHVNIILNSAANTAFDGRYDVSLEINTKGPSRLMEFGRGCNHLQLFLHISTAYVNGPMKGRLLEKAFRMGDSIAQQLKEEEASPLDIFHEFELANQILLKSEGHNIAQNMKDVALERATKHGWQNVYELTKAMGEMLLDYNRGQIPVAIVRPSVIEGSYSDPFPGWIEGLRMLDPVIAYYGKGQLTGFVGDPTVPLDIVPVDMVANTILAAMAKHVGKPGLEVYHVASSVANPILVEYINNLIFEHFKSNPYLDYQGKTIQVKEPLKLFKSMDDLYSHIIGNATTQNMTIKIEEGSSLAGLQRKERIAIKSIQRIIQMANLYQSYGSYEGRFDNSNTQGLFQELSEEEKKMFGFDVNDIDWKDYFLNTHFSGLRQHVMKEGGS